MSSGRHPHSVQVHPGRRAPEVARRVGSKIGRDGRERRHSDQRHNEGTCDCLVKRATISNSSWGIRRVDWPMASASPGRPCSPEDKRCSRLSGQALPRSGTEGGLQKPSSASTCNVCVHVGDRRPASLGGKHWRPWHQAVTALGALKHFNHPGGDVSVGHATGPQRLICPASPASVCRAARRGATTGRLQGNQDGSWPRVSVNGPADQMGATLPLCHSGLAVSAVVSSWGRSYQLFGHHSCCCSV